MAEVVLALDVDTLAAARELLDRIPGVRWAKIGSVLYMREGPALVEELRNRDIQVFLDLKWLDIPNTVAGAVRGAAAMGIAMATVHASGGREMLSRAAAVKGEMQLVAVTVLTSFTASSWGQTVGRESGDLAVEVLRLARLAVESGIDGAVCSAVESEAVSRVVPAGGPIVVPGIRPAGSAPGDQRRVATPAEAIRAGATHLVVGRPVLEAPDPAEAYHQIVSEVS